MAKPRKTTSSSVTIAGFSPAQWKEHMEVDEDWTERLEGAPESSVLEVVAALGHDSAEVRALACNLAYALGVDGLGAHAPAVVERLAAMLQGDAQAKVRTRARIVHEGLAGEVERAAVRREMPWLSAFDPAALDQALAAITDDRDAARLQVYLWWANAGEIAAQARASAIAALTDRAARETDAVLRQAADLALAHLRKN